ncbi:hypothetical protein K8R32_00475 [bacterium]|nr:hypothetical protein [bacterium]
MPNFQRTVNLKDSGNPEPTPEPKERPERLARPKKKSRSRRQIEKKRAEDIDEVFSDEVFSDNKDVEPKKELKSFEVPAVKPVSVDIYKNITIVLIAILIGVVIYFTVFAGSENKNQTANDFQEATWYSVKLINGETYYGQIADISADPVVIKNVYYNYEQLNNETDKAETGNLKLVKRGNETHGPDGSMNIVRAQVVLMEPLKEESKVLTAILKYEK